MSRMLFLNLPVRDLEHSKKFWKGLGFDFNPQFTDDKAGCLVISEQAFAMLLTEPYFKTFSTRAICDTTTHVEALFCLSCTRRAEVDEMVAKAIALGGSAVGTTQDHGFMYGRAFNDPDRHHWEVMWMDPGHVNQA